MSASFNSSDEGTRVPKDMETCDKRRFKLWCRSSVRMAIALLCSRMGSRDKNHGEAKWRSGICFPRHDVTFPTISSPWKCKQKLESCPSLCLPDTLTDADASAAVATTRVQTKVQTCNTSKTDTYRTLKRGGFNGVKWAAWPIRTAVLGLPTKN